MSECDFLSFTPSSAPEAIGALKNKRVIKLVRYSWWPAQDVAQECSISAIQAFSLTAGPVVVTVEGGVEIGVGSDPTLNSIVVWQEVGSHENLTKGTGEIWEMLFPIDANNVNYAGRFWAGLVGRTIVRISILKKREMSPIEASRPSELGLMFEFDTGERAVMAHGLHDGSDDFSVLEVSQVIGFEGLVKIDI